jgi:hypothetical protein
MYDPLSAPQWCSINPTTCRFSVPWSPQTLGGTPYILTPSRKTSRTVCALLLLLACRAVIKWEYPSMNPWTTIPHQIIPSNYRGKCHMININKSMNALDWLLLTMLAIMVPEKIRARDSISSSFYHKSSKKLMIWLNMNKGLADSRPLHSLTKNLQ